MSAPPDFLGLALGMIRQRQEQQSQMLDMKRQQMADQARMQALQEQQSNEALKLGATLAAHGWDKKSIFGVVGRHLDYGQMQFLEEAVKRNKEQKDQAQYGANVEAQIPTLAAQSLMGQDINPQLGNLQTQALQAFSPDQSGQVIGQTQQALMNQIAAQRVAQQQQAIAAAASIKDYRTKAGIQTNEGLRGFYAEQGYRNARDTVSVFVPPDTVGLAPGLQPGLNTIVGRDRANALINASQGKIREVPLSLAGQKMEDVGLTTPAATQGKLYDQLEFISEQRRTMKRIGENYDPRYTQYLGQTEASIGPFLEKLGVDTTQARKDFMAGYNSFKADLGNNLMAKIQQRAATTFTDRLYDRMRNWNLTEDLSDSQFRRLYKEINTELDLNYARTIYALKHDPVAAAEAEDAGQIPKQTREQIEKRYPNDRVETMIRTVEQRAIQAAVRSGASDQEAIQAGQDAVEREFFTPPQPGAK